MLGTTVAVLRRELAAGKTTSHRLVEEALRRIQDTSGEGARAFVQVSATALAEADASDALRAQGVVRSPIEGIPVSVKDLFDVSGQRTLAGSKALAKEPLAKADAPAVARLRAAGAIIVGRTATVEFAFGGVGLNPHYGTPKNPFDRESGGRVPGGSSAGAGVAVADGMCNMGLGTDTRGSVRIPAALCGVTAFKPTSSRIPKEGVFPLSASLDSVGTLSNSVECCAIYDAILAGETVSSARAPEALPLPGLRFLVPLGLLFDDLEPHVAATFERVVSILRERGAHIEERHMPILAEGNKLFKDGGLAAPEAFQVHRPILERHKDDYDPKVVSRIMLGANMSAADYIQLRIDREKLIAETRLQTSSFDALLYPTVAAVAPHLEEVQSDENYVHWNLRLLRNTGLINLLDGCAVSLPCHSSSQAPVGLSIAGMGGTDKHILAVARAVEQALCQASSAKLEEPPTKRAKL
eukprot:TRINITY_DN92894_c0_g1_i1.p1 TRINITY_DN92894_c0_g1~~TRINITY_DN92894_c0_g1_i1.p1  ORF type:complete len:468 (-),score=93.87 TRINITY_DN92894_c0_g1_i1:101-1504(-)